MTREEWIEAHPGVKEKILYAEERAAYWLAEGNEFAEKGNDEAAEKCYTKSTNALMRANELRRW